MTFNCKCKRRTPGAKWAMQTYACQPREYVQGRRGPSGS